MGDGRCRQSRSSCWSISALGGTPPRGRHRRRSGARGVAAYGRRRSAAHEPTAPAVASIRVGDGPRINLKQVERARGAVLRHLAPFTSRTGIIEGFSPDPTARSPSRSRRPRRRLRDRPGDRPAFGMKIVASRRTTCGTDARTLAGSDAAHAILTTRLRTRCCTPTMPRHAGRGHDVPIAARQRHRVRRDQALAHHVVGRELDTSSATWRPRGARSRAKPAGGSTGEGRHPPRHRGTRQRRVGPGPSVTASRCGTRLRHVAGAVGSARLPLPHRRADAGAGGRAAARNEATRRTASPSSDATDIPRTHVRWGSATGDKVRRLAASSTRGLGSFKTKVGIDVPSDVPHRGHARGARRRHPADGGRTSVGLSRSDRWLASSRLACAGSRSRHRPTTCSGTPNQDAIAPSGGDR